MVDDLKMKDTLHEGYLKHFFVAKDCMRRLIGLIYLPLPYYGKQKVKMYQINTFCITPASLIIFFKLLNSYKI